MSDLVVFIVGIVVFAITVYGTVMAGGIAFTRRQLDANPDLLERVDEEELERRVPVNVKF